MNVFPNDGGGSDVNRWVKGRMEARDDDHSPAAYSADVCDATYLFSKKYQRN